MSESLWYSKTKLLLLVTVLIMTGCGGSGSSNRPPPPPTNVAPTANAGPDQSVDRMVAVTLDGSASTDSDGTIASYAWMQTAGTTVTLDTAAPEMPTFMSPDTPAGEDLTFSLTVTDNDGATSTAATVTITVSANSAPAADAGPDQTVSALDVVTLDGSASTDADGTIAGYTWTQTTGTNVTLDETMPPMPTFTAPNVGGNEVLTFELVVTDNDGGVSLADTVIVTVDPTLALPFTDDFSDGNFDGWSVVDDAVTIASSWDASSNRLVNAGPTNIRSGDITETYRRGTYALLTDSVNLTNYRFSVDVTVRPTVNAKDDLGVMFRYIDDDNYYRLAVNGETGSTRLEAKTAGVWSTLAHDFRGYEPGDSLGIEAEVDGPLIQVFVNGDHLFAAFNEDHATGGVALYTRDGIRFDNVSITPSSTDPEIVIASPVANFVVPEGPRNINVVAIARNVPATTGSVSLEFVGGAACGAVTETNPGEYTASCPNRPVGEHIVRARILDNGGEVDRDSNEGVAIGAEGVGDRWDAIGDSLTLGLYDNFARDNLNLTDRKTISTRGWSGPLSDMLTTTLGQANLVGNEGISGDRSGETRIQRLSSILERNSVPRSNRAILMLGTNDSNIGGGGPDPSGLGCVGAACNGTYKGEMIAIIEQLQSAGRDTVYLPMLPPVFGNNTSTVYATQLDAGNERQQAIIEYNTVISTELSTMPGVALGPDLFNCFLNPTVDRFSLFQDSLHMNSLGYAMVAALWHDAITAGPVLPPMDPCPAPIYILDGLDGTMFKQNLLEAGDEYYNDTGFSLTNVPTELADAIWVTQDNADNANADANFMSFDVGANPVTVYIAYDPAGGPPASATHAFAAGAALSSNLTTDDGSVGTFSFVEVTGVTGVVTLGGTVSDGGAARQGYLVIIVP